MGSLRITFVHAPLGQHDHFDAALFSPLWAYTLAAHVPAAWTVTVADCLLEDSTGIAPADVFAFSGTNQDIDSIRSVHALLRAKYPLATFVLGGPITWSLEQEGKLALVDFFDRIFILDGEQTLPHFLNHVEQNTANSLPKVIRGERFPLDQALPMRFDLYRRHAADYYGATIEVSRGCPFLCEFCDVRVLPDNNRANNKNPDLIIRELDAHFAAGVTQFLFVCDNFIGDVAWARDCVDAILAWQMRTGARLSIFTWTTINISKLPDLMAKMRQAGFSVLYIGIESVNQDALLETAKVQNRVALKPAVTSIQALGFIVVPGFIFGFDSDRPALFENTLDFIVETGLIGGDPSFLMAMPGTPLFERMKRTGRLVDAKGGATSRRKIATNIRYLLDADFLARGFLRFVKHLTSTQTQWARFRRHVDLLAASERFVPVGGSNASGGARIPLRFLRLQLSNPSSRRILAKRLAYLLKRPVRLLVLARGWLHLKKASRGGRNLDLHFYFWAYAWTSIGLRYRALREEDVSLHSVAGDYDFAQLLEGETSAPDVATERLRRADPKVALQTRHTRRALQQLVANKVARDPTDSTERDIALDRRSRPI